MNKQIVLIKGAYLNSFTEIFYIVFSNSFPGNLIHAVVGNHSGYLQATIIEDLCEFLRWHKPVGDMLCTPVMMGIDFLPAHAMGN